MGTLSLSSPLPFTLGKNKNNKKTPFLSLKAPDQLRLAGFPPNQSSLCVCNPIGYSIHSKGALLTTEKKRNLMRRSGVVCYAAPAPLTVSNLQWISTISSVALMLAKGTAVRKSLIVPLFALQAPACVTAWIRGEYGIWSAFLALLVRLFFFIPGELELPLTALLLVIVAPYQVMNLRGTQEGAIISLVIAAYLAYEHFSWTGSLRRAFDQGSLLPTLAIICITAASCLLLV